LELFRVVLESAPTAASLDWVALAGVVVSLAGNIIIAAVAIVSSRMTLRSATSALEHAQKLSAIEAQRERLALIVDALADVASLAIQDRTDTNSDDSTLNRAAAILRLRLPPDEPEHRPIIAQLDKLSLSQDRLKWSRELTALGAAAVAATERRIV
jgi:hypothetical protein